MANFKLSIEVLAIAILATVVAGQKLIAPRLIGGVPIDTLRRFPHHVTIEPVHEGYGENGAWLCAGSILNEQWILTSARCVDQSIRVKCHFEKLYSNKTVGSYTAVVNSDAIRIYPTYYDDIALVKIPFRLVYSDTIKPVAITSQPLSQLENKLAVLPGFDTNANYSSDASAQQLTYGMFNIISNTKCKQSFKDGEFDEYQQLCTESWQGNQNIPCFTDFGSALISGWPAKPELVGIYSSTSHDCSSNMPSVYTNVLKYVSWINSVINS